jgi:pyruvate dehydrogenase E2 component (dihydrolipoamide acetyltransferase)
LLAEIETDKATMELESYKDGVLLHRGADDGGKLQVNDLLAIIGKEGEDVAALIKENSGSGGTAAPAEKQEEKPQEKEEAPLAEEKPKAQAAAQPSANKAQALLLCTAAEEKKSAAVDISKWKKLC